jgi:hypothetical protein
MSVDHHRWNIDRDGSDLLICEGDHEKHEGCEYVRYVRADLAVLATPDAILALYRERDEARERIEALSDLANGYKAALASAQEEVARLRAICRAEGVPTRKDDSDLDAIAGKPISIFRATLTQETPNG